MTQFGMVENGYITTEKQAEFLERHGHLEAIIKPKMKIRASQLDKYFTFRGRGFHVIYIANIPVQIIRMSEDEVKRIASCAKIKFGGF